MKIPFYLCLTAAFLLSACSMAGESSIPTVPRKKRLKVPAMKATVGVGGRCSPAEAAKDTAKRAVK